MFGWRFDRASWNWKHALAAGTGLVCAASAALDVVAPIAGPLGQKAAIGVAGLCLFLTRAGKALGVTQEQPPEAPKP